MSQEWLDGLKAGDIVSVKVHLNSTTGVWLGKVDKVTPSGRKVVGRATFRPDGSEWGRKDSYTWSELVEPTPELKEQIRLIKLRQELKGQLERLRPDKLTPEVLGLLSLLLTDTDDLTSEVCKSMKEAYWSNLSRSNPQI